MGREIGNKQFIIQYARYEHKSYLFRVLWNIMYKSISMFPVRHPSYG